jgi:hypothetical protein
VAACSFVVSSDFGACAGIFDSIVGGCFTLEEEQPCNNRIPAQIRSVKILNIVR